MKSFQVGNSEISFLDAKQHTVTLLEMFLYGKSIYGNIRLDKKQKSIIQKKIEEIKKW